VSSIYFRHAQFVGIIAAWAALASIVTKEILYRWTAGVGLKLRSHAMVANAWHHRSDMLSSIPAFAAIGVALVFPNWNFVDHVGAVVVSVFIFHVALKIGLPSMREILEAGAPREVIRQISSLALEEKGVLGVHGIRSRYVSNSLILDMHIVIDALTPLFRADIIADSVRKRLLEQRDDILDVVVHMDPDRIPDTEGDRQ
jgi:cation diffusion facilitator family transporter